MLFVNSTDYGEKSSLRWKLKNERDWLINSSAHIHYYTTLLYSMGSKFNGGVYVTAGVINGFEKKRFYLFI